MGINAIWCGYASGEIRMRKTIGAAVIIVGIVLAGCATEERSGGSSEITCGFLELLITGNQELAEEQRELVELGANLPGTMRNLSDLVRRSDPDLSVLFDSIAKAFAHSLDFHRTGVQLKEAQNSNARLAQAEIGC